MAFPQYDPSKHLAYLNGKRITSFGENEDPIKIRPLRDKGTIKQGFGDDAVGSSISRPGAEVELSIMPGTKDSATASGIANAGGVVEFQLKVIATGEYWIASEGLYKTHNEFGRGGSKPTDDGFIFMFNKTDWKTGAA